MAITLIGLSYTEASSGLGTPQMDGGRTEMEFADVNGDGHLDIVSVGDHGSPRFNTDEHGIMVWFGDGRSHWSVYQNGDFGYGGVAAGDVNNDGLMDMGWGVHHNYSGNDFGDQLVEVAVGDGTGQNWSPWDDGLAQEGQDWGMFGVDFGDINNDGWLDLGSNSFGADDGVWVYLNNRDGTWTNSFGFAGGNSSEDFVFGDVNRDGFLDFAVSHDGATIYLGDGTGDFSAHDNGLPGPGYRRGIDLGDVDDDGGDDLSFVNSQGGLEVWVYDEGQAAWLDFSGSLPDTGSFQATQLADMDNDGHLDLAAFGNGFFALYLGDGAGGWTSDTSFWTVNPDSASGDMAAFRAGPDADHNGFGDILIVDDEGDSWSSVNTPRFFRETSEPSGPAVFPVFPRGGERFYGNSVRFVDWRGADTTLSGTVKLQLSLSGPSGPWTDVASGLPNNGRFQWQIPNTPSDNCYIRYVLYVGQDSAMATTPRAFEIIGVGAEENSSGPRMGLRPGPGRIWFYLPSRGPVRLSAYDARGALAGVIVQTEMAPGEHEIAWKPARCGIYFILLESGGRRLWAKTAAWR